MKTTVRVLFLFVSLFLTQIVDAQETNIRAKDPKTGNDILVGEATVEGLINIGDWFNTEYNTYTPDSVAISALKQYKDKLPDIFVVMGTWCGDSKEHVPHFFKIADMVGYPKQKIFMVAVDRDKKGGNFCLADFDITLVPTFIFTSHGKEIGRIIETPTTTLEQDMVNVITNNK